MIPPLQLDEILKQCPKDLIPAIKQLYYDTYRYAHEQGKRDQRDKCECNEDQED